MVMMAVMESHEVAEGFSDNLAAMEELEVEPELALEDALAGSTLGIFFSA